VNKDFQTRLVTVRPSEPCQDIWTDLSQNKQISEFFCPLYCLRYYD